jgi:7,8-dihydropterin-6-yl-methyl-4-(beta-D-ribofuranosyl)aminobenzene 5'-phosphate synthase
MDWGSAALVRGDLTRLDAAVISHRHGDHTSGLNHLFEVNPGVKIYAPVEGAFFKSPVPRAFLTLYDTLPADMQYYRGKEPCRAFGIAW